MSDQPKQSKSLISNLQPFLAILTPLIVAVFGTMINSSVNKTEQEINAMKAQMDKLKTEMDLKIGPVKAMKPFMDMLSEDSTTARNIMGAYGIYMLKKDDDSKIAAQMIASTQKEALFDVLTDIAEDDSVVRNWINRFKVNAANVTSDELVVLEGNNTKIDNLSEYQRYLLKLTGELERSELKKEDDTTNDEEDINANAIREPAGWIYLGNGSNLVINDPEKMVIKSTDWAKVKEKTFVLQKSINLRKGKPKPPNYKNQKLIKVLQKDTEFKIDTFTIDSKKHVWAKIILL